MFAEPVNDPTHGTSWVNVKANVRPVIVPATVPLVGRNVADVVYSPETVSPVCTKSKTMG
jgi:hypothetical protein